MEKIKHLEPRALKRALGQSPINQMKTFIPKNRTGYWDILI